MMARRSFVRSVLGIVAGSGAMLLVGCGNYSTQSYRVRVTVEVETPVGMKRGSSVMEVLSAKRLQILAEGGAGASGLRGEAVVTETPSGPVFMLLTLPDARGTLQGAMTVALAPDARNGIDAYLSAVSKLGGWFAGTTRAELPRGEWPLMVRFRDISDPASVERVDPGSVGVRRVLLETTSDDVSVGIQEILKWLPNQRGSLIRRLSLENPANPPIGATITKLDFSTELLRGK